MSEQEPFRYDDRQSLQWIWARTRAFIRTQIHAKKSMRFKTVAACCVIGFVFLSWAMLREMSRVRAQSLTSWLEDQTADCGIALTGGPNRIREGIDLLARKSIQKLIISGVNPQTDLRQIFPQMPYYGDISEKDVILERRSRTTFGNAQQSNPLVEALRCRDVILITSRAHMYRALQTFRAEFPPNIAILPRAVASQTADPGELEVAVEATKSLFYSLWAY